MIVALGETLSEKLPSMSVITPFVVPFSNTLAPITVSPVASVTVPVSWMFCAHAPIGNMKAKKRSS